MNLILKANLCLVLILCIYSSMAQTDFRSGYIITNENDTIHGLIDYRGGPRNAKECNFRENESSPVREFKPFDIKAYRFTDSKFYISKSIKINDNEIPVFLEFLVNGIADLYYYADGTSIHYFIEKQDGKLIELTNAEERVNVGGHEYARESKRYIGLLTYAFSDCPQIFPSINRAKFNDESLVEVTKEYHDYKCEDGRSCIIYEKKLPVVKLKFASYISLNRSTLDLLHAKNYEAIRFDAAYHPSIALQLNFDLPRASEKLSLQVAGILSKSDFHGVSAGLPDWISEEAEIHVTTLQWQAGIRYTYPKGKIRPTVVVGGDILGLLSDNQKRTENMLVNGEPTTYIYNEGIMAKRLLGFNIDLGIDYHVSSSFVPFFNIGYCRLSGNNTFNSIENNTTPVMSVLQTFYFSAGLYF